MVKRPNSKVGNQLLEDLGETLKDIGVGADFWVKTLKATKAKEGKCVSQQRKKSIVASDRMGKNI